MKPAELIEYATTTPIMEGRQVTLAHLRRTLDDWKIHIMGKLLPAYQSAKSEPFEGMSLADIHETATRLKDYYERIARENSQNERNRTRSVAQTPEMEKGPRGA